METIDTIYGPMDPATLMKEWGEFDEPQSYGTFVQYKLLATGELVHRSAVVNIKRGQEMDAITGVVG